jgi:CRISPR-associated protein Cmr3
VIIEIKPFDTLFFRNARSFSMGDDSWADGVFPPSPSVIYGVLRSAWFAEHMEEFKKAATLEDPTLKLRIKKFYYESGGSSYLPLPADLVAGKTNSSNDKVVDLFPLKIRDIRSRASSSPLQSILVSPKGSGEVVSSVEAGIMSIKLFRDYLQGEFAGLKAQKLESFRILEPKIGIARSNHSRSAEEGMLYRVGMSRLNNLSMVVEFEGISLPEAGFLKIGGEGKGASYKSLESKLFELAPPDAVDGLFKAYLLTPAVFSKGWIPGWLDDNSLEGSPPGSPGRVRLITASLTPPLRLGGFDMKKQKAKPMRTAVGAGSVYYFECIDGNPVDLARWFHEKPISDDEGDCNQGFGICLAGKAVKS